MLRAHQRCLLGAVAMLAVGVAVPVMGGGAVAEQPCDARGGRGSGLFGRWYIESFCSTPDLVFHRVYGKCAYQVRDVVHQYAVTGPWVKGNEVSRATCDGSLHWVEAFNVEVRR